MIMKEYIMYDPSHPGEILREDYIEPLDLDVTSMAEKLMISRKQLSLILNEKAGISPLMSLKLAKVFGTSPEFFLRLQQQYDLAKARTEFEKIEKDLPVLYQEENPA